MAKNSITDYDKVSANNTDVQSVDISEGCSPSGINNAIREVMADLADVNDGTVALTSPAMGSATISGDLTVDTDTLHVDSTNNRVGIGTTSPAYELDVAGQIQSGGLTSPYNSGVIIGASTDATSNRASISYGDWFVGQDSASNGTKDFFFYDGLAAAHRMNIDTGGRVTMPYQTAFYAYGSGSQSWSGTLSYNTLVLANQKNLGSRSTGYNTTNSTFTAPVAGTYGFMARMTQSTSVGGPAMYLYVNGVKQNNEIAISYYNNYLTNSGFMFLNLASGDAVTVRVGNLNNVTMTLELSRCAFAGWLIG